MKYINAVHRTPDCTGEWRTEWHGTLAITEIWCPVCGVKTTDIEGAQRENELSEKLRTLTLQGKLQLTRNLPTLLSFCEEHLQMEVLRSTRRW
jgi:hypothetical protein